MKFLFVSNYWDYHYSGAHTLSHSHFEALSEITCNDGGGHIISVIVRKEEKRPDSRRIVHFRCNPSRYATLMNMLRGNAPFYNSEAENLIVDLVKHSDYDFVWFDDAVFGSTVRKIKRSCPSVPVFVFWHIVPTRADDNGIRSMVLRLSSMVKGRQRALSAKYSDASIILNSRDEATFLELYGKNAEFMLPMCLEDKARISPSQNTGDEFKILFVGGGLHGPNVDGIKWFAKNVMPGLNRKAVLYIVGNAMEKFKSSPEFAGNDRLRILGRVDDLNECYSNADVVIAPILYGAGMMTKVAEALMHGKNILATGHALNGYECLSDSRCDTAEDFITKINAMIETGTEKYNPAMRKFYEEKYSLEAMKAMLREFLSGRGIMKEDDGK